MIKSLQCCLFCMIPLYVCLCNTEERARFCSLLKQSESRQWLRFERCCCRGEEFLSRSVTWLQKHTCHTEKCVSDCLVFCGRSSQRDVVCVKWYSDLMSFHILDLCVCRKSLQITQVNAVDVSESLITPSRCSSHNSSEQRHTSRSRCLSQAMLFHYLGLFISNHAQNTCILLYE